VPVGGQRITFEGGTETTRQIDLVAITLADILPQPIEGLRVGGITKIHTRLADPVTTSWRLGLVTLTQPSRKIGIRRRSREPACAVAMITDDGPVVDTHRHLAHRRGRLALDTRPALAEVIAEITDAASSEGRRAFRLAGRELPAQAQYGILDHPVRRGASFTPPRLAVMTTDQHTRVRRHDRVATIPGATIEPCHLGQLARESSHEGSLVGGIR